MTGLEPSWSKGALGKPGGLVTKERLWRSKGGIRIHKGCKYPILLHEGRLAYLPMLKIHEVGHRIARYMLQKSRSTAWVVKGKSLAERVVVEACVESKIRKIMKD